jgi:LPXTG-motif cell wall-anchored protein
MRKLAAGVALMAGSALFSFGVAGAQTTQPCPESPQVCPPPSVGGEEVTPPGGQEVALPRPVTPQVGGAQVQAQAGLPVTGTDTAVLLGAGAALVAGGGALVLRSKRTTAGSH